jgi:tRNA threonylcarbamoyladenosine biosynthesis protein TsaE
VAAGETLGRTLAPGAVVWLQGSLGAGKTTMAQAIVRALGAPGRATSPTYSLVHRYEGRRGPVYHVDCFRLRNPDEAADLDWETLAAGDALLIEWPERAGSWAPPPDHQIRLAHLDAGPALRRVVIEGGAS